MPDRPQRRDRRQGRQRRRCSRGVQRSEELKAVVADLAGIGLARGCGLGQPEILDAAAVAFIPGGRGEGAQPIGLGRGDRVEGGAQRLAQELEPVQLAHGGEDVGGIGALPAAGLEQAVGAARLEHPLQQALLGAAGEQAAAEVAQKAEVEAGVAQLQVEQILPVDARPHRLGGLAIAQPLAELQERDQGQAPGRAAGAPARDGDRRNPLSAKTGPRSSRSVR